MEDGLLVDGDAVNYLICQEGGSVRIKQNSDGRFLARMQGDYGPLYDPSDMTTRDAEITWTKHDAAITVTTRQTSGRYEGLVMERDLVLSGGAAVQVIVRTLNRGEEAQQPEMMWNLRRDWTRTWLLSLPLRDGMVQTTTRGYPAGEQEVPRSTAKYAESWVAMEDAGTVIGLIWDDAWDELRYHWSPGIRRPALNVPAHQWAEPARFWLVVGTGSWRDVQRAYAQISGVDGASLQSGHSAITTVGLSPAVPLLASGEAELPLVVRHRRERHLIGTLELVAPEGWEASPVVFDLAGVHREAPYDAVVALKPPSGGAELGGDELKVLLRSRLADTPYSLPFVVIGPSDGLAVSSSAGPVGDEWMLDSGRGRIVVAPGHSGAVVGWYDSAATDAVNHLATDYPEPTARGWMAPWYGGIWPVAWAPQESYPGKLYMEDLVAEPFDLQANGITWRGVRLAGTLKRDRMTGLAVVISYAVAGTLPLLRASFRVENQTSAVRRLHGGFSTFWALDGDGSRGVLRCADWESKRTNIMDDWIHAGNWGSVSNPATGKTAIAVSHEPTIILTDEGISSHALESLGEMAIRPEGAIERVTYFGLADDFDRAKSLACLSVLE
jgi:hypothetical protein